MTLTEPSLKYLLAAFSATGLEEIRIFKGLAKGSPGFLRHPLCLHRGAVGRDSVWLSRAGGAGTWTLALKWQVHIP